MHSPIFINLFRLIAVGNF